MEYFVISSGYALYEAAENRLVVTRPGENLKRYIPCTNLNPTSMKVHGVQVNGDEIWVLIGPKGNMRPNRKLIYRFSSLLGGGSSNL